VTGGSLQAFVLDHADAFDDLAEMVLDGGACRVVAGGNLAAVVEPDALEVRLRAAVATAALRMPDTTASGRGRGWVRFAPADLDDFSRDRALAWLDSAVRLAAEGGEPG
jgi:hypothetical protein